MEILGIIFVLFFLWFVFKVLGLIFYTGAFLITFPLKIIATILLLALLIPLGIIGFTLSLIGIIIPLLPLIIIFFVIAYLLKNRKLKS